MEEKVYHFTGIHAEGVIMLVGQSQLVSDTVMEFLNKGYSMKEVDIDFYNQFNNLKGKIHEGDRGMSIYKTRPIYGATQKEES